MPVREVTEYRGHTGLEITRASYGTISVCNNSQYLSKDQKYRGMLYITENDTIINGHRVREALDALTIDGVESVEIPCHKNRSAQYWESSYSYRRMHRPYRLRMTSSGRIALTAPCGETRVFSVRTLDRILTYFGC